MTMKNAVVSWASGDSLCHSDGFRVYLKSLEVIDNADFYILTNDMPADTRAYLGSKNIKVVDQHLVHSIIRDRHLALWQFLTEHQYDLCLFTDCRDLYFQRNPFRYEHLPRSEYIILTAEGMKHSESPWNSDGQHEAQKRFREFTKHYGDRPVVNGGVMMGSTTLLKDYLLLLWTNTVQAGIIDQNVLNYLWYFLEHDERYQLKDPNNDAFCVTGEPICHGLFAPPVNDGVFCNPITQEPYYIVHQWDRTPVREQVLRKYLLS